MSSVIDEMRVLTNVATYLNPGEEGKKVFRGASARRNIKVTKPLPRRKDVISRPSPSMHVKSANKKTRPSPYTIRRSRRYRLDILADFLDWRDSCELSDNTPTEQIKHETQTGMLSPDEHSNAQPSVKFKPEITIKKESVYKRPNNKASVQIKTQIQKTPDFAKQRHIQWTGVQMNTNSSISPVKQLQYSPLSTNSSTCNKQGTHEDLQANRSGDDVNHQHSRQIRTKRRRCRGNPYRNRCITRHGKTYIPDMDDEGNVQMPRLKSVVFRVIPSE